jgi:hypothetical protein
MRKLLMASTYYTYLWRMSSNKFYNDVFVAYRIIFSLRDRLLDFRRGMGSAENSLEFPVAEFHPLSIGPS